MSHDNLHMIDFTALQDYCHMWRVEKDLRNHQNCVTKAPKEKHLHFIKFPSPSIHAADAFVWNSETNNNFPSNTDRHSSQARDGFGLFPTLKLLSPFILW